MVSDEEIREAFRVRAAVMHPDSGGDEQEFAKLQGARDVLLSPARRLKEWMSARRMEADARGQIEGGLMDLFQKVSEVGAASELLMPALAMRADRVVPVDMDVLGRTRD